MSQSPDTGARARCKVFDHPLGNPIPRAQAPAANGAEDTGCGCKSGGSVFKKTGEEVVFGRLWTVPTIYGLQNNRPFVDLTTE